jgi:hypothetical protein
MAKNREPIDDWIDAHVWMSQQSRPNASPMTASNRRAAAFHMPGSESKYRDSAKDCFLETTEI